MLHIRFGLVYLLIVGFLSSPFSSCLLFIHFSFYQIYKLCLILEIGFLNFLNSLPNGNHPDLLIVVDFSNSPVSGKIPSLVKNS